MLSKIILILVTLSPLVAWSYPQYIGKGYHACLTCHYNPFGNGPLNDYGRGVAATALSGRAFISDKTSNEVLSERSGFLFNTPKNSWFRPALDYRGMDYRTNLQDNDLKSDRWINMQMEVNTTFILDKAAKTFVSISYNVIPSNSSNSDLSQRFQQDEGEDVYFSREHYVGHRLTDSLGVYLGKMDKVFGIRVPDHNSYARNNTNNNQYSSTHGAMVHYGKETFDLGVQYFVGDLEQEEERRSSGFTGKYEHSVLDKLRLGISYLNETQDNKTNDSIWALIYKQQIGKGSSIMFEYGNRDRTPDGGDTTTSQYVFLQNHILLSKGLYYMMTFQHWNPDVSNTRNEYRIAPGIQWMPVQRVELRFELENTKIVDTTSAPKDTWSYLGQVHLWF